MLLPRRRSQSNRMVGPDAAKRGALEHSDMIDSLEHLEESFFNWSLIHSIQFLHTLSYPHNMSSIMKRSSGRQVLPDGRKTGALMFQQTKPYVFCCYNVYTHCVRSQVWLSVNLRRSGAGCVLLAPTVTTLKNYGAMQPTRTSKLPFKANIRQT